MPFPTAAGKAMLAEALRHAQTLAAAVKRDATTQRDRAIVDGLSWTDVIHFHDDLEGYRARLAQRAATPGLAAYAQEQFADPNLDIVTDYNNMHSEIVATRDWLQINIPMGTPGSFVNNVFTPTHYPPAALSAYVTQLNQLIATID